MRQSYSKEGHVKDDVKAILDEHGWFWWMTPANGYGKSGVSDIVAIRGPRETVFMAIECKFGSNKPTVMQIGFLNTVRQEGGFAFVVNDKNLPWFKAFMESFDIAAIAMAQGEKIPEEHGARMANALIELSNKLLDVSRGPASPDGVQPEGAVSA